MHYQADDLRYTMFVKILSVIYLFLIRLRFPSKDSVASVIRKRYGDEVLSKIRKFEKLDFRCKKSKLDITFLTVCLEKDVMPNFVQFRTTNKRLKASESYYTCQRLLLNQELDKKNQN